jgi:hypothetical protein
LNASTFNRERSVGLSYSQTIRGGAFPPLLSLNSWCRRGDLNPHGDRPPPPQDGVSTNSTTSASSLILTKVLSHNTLEKTAILFVSYRNVPRKPRPSGRRQGAQYQRNDLTGKPRPSGGSFTSSAQELGPGAEPEPQAELEPGAGPGPKAEPAIYQALPELSEQASP